MKASQTSDVLLERLLQLHPKIIDLTLDRVYRLLDALGNPQDDLPPVVHVAGTNGKGSTIAMMRAGLEASGHRVHVYTSPHLVRFHERIRLGGALIEESDLAALLAECEDANGTEPITFFEITTVAAILAFAREAADYLLLEVGLGGRLDATNVIERPALTVITPVSIDHQQHLGETVEEIAAEKAGILKQGVPCIVGPQTDAALTVIRNWAEMVGAPLLIHGEEWLVRTEHGRVVYQDETGLLDLNPPVLPGAHQVENAGTAIAGIRALGIGEDACDAALSRAEWPARMQRLRRGPLVGRLPDGVELWLDGGHNAAAGEALAAALDDWHARAPAPVHLIIGMLDTKPADDFLQPLAPRIVGLSAVTIPDTAASYDAGALAAEAVRLDIRAHAAESVTAALDHVIETTPVPARVIICGSLYLAGHVLERNG